MGECEPPSPTTWSDSSSSSPTRRSTPSPIAERDGLEGEPGELGEHTRRSDPGEASGELALATDPRASDGQPLLAHPHGAQLEGEAMETGSDRALARRSRRLVIDLALEGDTLDLGALK